MRARLLAALVAGAVVTGAGCTADDAAPTAGSAGPPAAPASVAAEHGAADVAFVQGMHPHHEGALAMAELAPARAGDPRVTALAARVAAAQGPELARLEALATAWRVELTGDAARAEHTGGHTGEHGETDDAAALQGLSGDEFDRQFLTRMVAHHEGALPMARAQLASGTNPDARALAEEVLAAQQAEIAEMQQLLTGL